MASCAAFFDLNGTLTRGEPVFEFLALLHERGLCPDGDFDGVREAVARFRRQEIANEVVADAMFDVLGRAVEGLPTAGVLSIYAGRYGERLRRGIFPFAPALVERLRDGGCQTFAVTNVPQPLLAPLLADLGIERSLAPSLEQNEGCFTGRVLDWGGPRSDKGDRVRRVAAREGIDLGTSFAFGDSEGDATFLALVGHPVAVRPTAALELIARARRWPIVRDVTSVDEVARLLVLPPARRVGRDGLQQHA